MRNQETRENHIKVDNCALLFYKWPFLKEDDESDVIEALKQEKAEILKKLRKFCPKSSKQKELYEDLWQEFTSLGFVELVLRTTSRLAIGLGIPSFFENGLSFHHTYGVPYIPASSLKGLLRFAYLAEATGLLPLGAGIEKAFTISTKEPAEALAAVAKLDELLATKEDFKKFSRALYTTKVKIKGINGEYEKELKQIIDPINDKLKTFYDHFTRLFGTLHKKGELQLLDALPEEFELGIDLINPHFKEYYQSGEQERQRNATFLVGEWHNPVPVPFLVVEEATFKVFYKGAEKKVEELLKKALNLLGVGGKKGKGYGRLEPT